MDQADIRLSPRTAALLDLDDHGAPITLDDAEHELCHGTDLGDQFGDGSNVRAFGTNQEVWFDSDPSTGQCVFVTLWPGYTGSLSFQGENGQDQYTIAVGSLTKNGMPFQLDWGLPYPLPQNPLLLAEVDELYRGLVTTFSSAPPPAPGTLCTDTGACIVIEAGEFGAIYFPDLGFAIWVDNPTTAQPVPSTPTRLDIFP